MMTLHGFRTVEQFINACKVTGEQVTTSLYEKIAKTNDIPQSLDYATFVTDSPMEEKTTFPASNPPDKLVVIERRYKTERSDFFPDGVGLTWMIFSTDLNHLYADGWHTDFRPLLKSWGYKKVTE